MRLALTTLAVLTFAAPAQSADGLAIERQLAFAHPGRFFRQGTTLTIGNHRYVDTGSCADDDGQCTTYRVDSVLKDYIGVSIGYYESSGYLLVGPGALNAVEIGSRPISSPSGGRFFVGYTDERQWTPLQGASVWEWSPFPRRLRVVDPDLAAFEKFIAWRGDDCVEFLGNRGFNVKLLPARLFWLVETAGDWQLHETRPQTCK